MHLHIVVLGSNNTNKLSPQERCVLKESTYIGSNNTNKLSPQEPIMPPYADLNVQIIQINLVLKNA